MSVKKTTKTVFIVAAMSVSLFFSFVSCKQGDEITNVSNITNIVYKDAEEESLDFVSEALPFYKLSDTPTDVLYARFYNGDHFVPYVAIRYYLETFDAITFTSTRYSDGKYYYEYRLKGKSFPIVVDVKNDTIYCTEWACYLEQNVSEREEYVKQKMLKIVTSYSGQKGRTFFLKKYGMEIYGGADDAYIPLCVLNQLFTARNYKEIFYNGEGIYFFDSESNFQYAGYGKSRWYMAGDGSVCERPQKLIDLSYNMLCFTHDYFYGQPGYYGFADDGNGFPDAAKVRAADSLGFDEMLSAYDTEVKTMLKSSSYETYIKGLIRLFLFTYGDSHSIPECIFTSFMPNFSSEEKNALITAFNDTKGRSTKINKKSERTAELIGARKKAAGRTDAQGNAVPFYVLSGGKTAVFTFDSFEIDGDAWEKYYMSSHVAANPNPADFAGWGLTFPNDSMGEFYAALYKLFNDSAYSNVKTLLIDISNNGGGADLSLMKLVSYMVDEFYFRKYDAHTDTRYDCYISADLNLDGNIDSADAAYRKTLRDKFSFVVLASRRSFSCGNIFPVICAEEGIPIIGERSGGGACAVGYGGTADGFPYLFSFNQRLSRKSDWSTVENGVPATSGGEITAAQDFYDDAQLQKIIDRIVK